MELASQIVATLTESTNMVGPEVRMEIIYHTVENLGNKLKLWLIMQIILQFIAKESYSSHLKLYIHT